MVMFADSSRSISSDGTGTMITRMLAIMPMGRIRSAIRAQGPDAAKRGPEAEDICRSIWLIRSGKVSKSGPNVQVI